MRIALVTESFLPRLGGAEFVVHHLANQWVSQGHDVCVFNTESAQATETDALYKVRRYALWRGAERFGHHRFPWLQTSAHSLGRGLRTFRPEFVSGHFAYPVSLYLARAKPDCGFILTPHEPDIVQGVRYAIRDRFPIDRILEAPLSQASAVIAISGSARQALQDLRVPASKIVEIPNGVVIERFRKPVRANVCSPVRVPPEARLILTVARHNRAKNLRAGLEAFASIAAEFRDLLYLVAGKGVSELGSDVQRLGLSGRVLLHEQLAADDLMGAYQRATVYLSTSLAELWPLVILEAMASGLPQVATDVPGNRDLVQNGVTGLLVPPGDPARLAEAMKKLLTDQPLRERMKTASLAESEKYDWGPISRRYLELAS